MVFAVVNVGTVANDGTGDTLRTGMQTVNANFLLAAPLASPTFTGTVTGAAATFTGILTVAAGAVGAPSITIASDTNTGFWAPAADTLAASCGGTEIIRISTTGLGVNMTPTGALSVKGLASATVFFVNNASASTMLATGTANLTVATGASGANSMLTVNKDSGTSRSINAAGTINASGADYAEYEAKAPGCGPIAKGQIIGFDSDGRVTDKWADAFSFGVKSTDPSYVGGDTWGSEEALGLSRPVMPLPPNPPKITATGEDFFKASAHAKANHKVALAAFGDEMKAYDAACAAFTDKLEAARQTVDRIAYSGKAPCNVWGASVGDYIVAVRDGDGINGEPVNSPTIPPNAAGRVRAILPDGRCTIAVIVT